MVKKEFDVYIESVVANEEIGNQYLVINIYVEETREKFDRLMAKINAGEIPMFTTNTFLAELYDRNVIKDKTVIIDCTW